MKILEFKEAWKKKVYWIGAIKKFQHKVLDSQLKLGEDYKIRAIGEIEALTEQLNEAKGEVEKLHEVNMNCSRENAALEDNNREIKQRGEELK